MTALAKRATSVESLGRRRARILLADDDVAYGDSLRALLEMEGHEVHQVLDGEQAVTVLREMGSALDLVLCDLLLPRLTGFEVVKEMITMDLDVPVLALTGVYENVREIHALRGLGVRGYVHKSVPFDHVMFRVNQILFPASANRRMDRRVAVAVPVRFSVGDRHCYGATYNVSVSGLYVRTPESMEPGELIDLAFALPTAHEMLRARAEVMHVASVDDVRGTAYPAGFGARFLDLSALSASVIRRFVERIGTEEDAGPGSDAGSEASVA